MPEWMRAVLEAVKANAPKDFVGQLEINVFNGGVSNINVKQSYKEATAK